MDVPHRPEYSLAKTLRSSHRIPNQTRTPICVCSPRCANCPKPLGGRFRFYAECDTVRTGNLPAGKRHHKCMYERPAKWMNISATFTWMNTDIISPMDVYDRSGTNINQMNDDSSNEHSQTKAAATNTIMRIGSWAMVNVNIANDGPNARNVQPKNSGKVILTATNFIYFGRIVFIAKEKQNNKTMYPKYYEYDALKSRRRCDTILVFLRLLYHFYFVVNVAGWVYVLRWINQTICLWAKWKVANIQKRHKASMHQSVSLCVLLLPDWHLHRRIWHLGRDTFDWLRLHLQDHSNEWTPRILRNCLRCTST